MGHRKHHSISCELITVGSYIYLRFFPNIEKDLPKATINYQQNGNDKSRKSTGIHDGQSPGK